MDHPPSTARPSRVAARRTLFTTAAALSAIVAPVGIVAATLGGSGALEVQPISRTEPSVRSQAAGDAVRFTAESVGAGDELARLQQLVTPPSTTPPAPTTTTPPTTAPPTTVAPAPARKGADPNDPATWDRLAQCESGGNWAANTGNGYYGGLQFSAHTWRAVGGSGLPHENSRETQIEMAKRLQARAGWGQWPACTRKLGYR